MFFINDLDIEKMIIKTKTGEVIEKGNSEIVQTLIERHCIQPHIEVDEECTLFDERGICIYTGTVDSVARELKAKKLGRIGWWFTCFSTNGMVQYSLTIEAGMCKYHAKATFPSVGTKFSDEFGTFRTSDLKLNADKPCADNLTNTKFVMFKGFRIVIGNKCVECVRDHLIQSLNFYTFPNGIDKFTAAKQAKKVCIGDIYSMMTKGDIPGKYGCAVVTDDYSPIATSLGDSGMGFFEEEIQAHTALYRHRNIIEFRVSMRYERTVYRGCYSAEDTIWIRVTDSVPENSTSIGYAIINSPDGVERFPVNIYITDNLKWYAVKGEEQLNGEYINIQFGGRYGYQASNYEDITVEEES